MRTETILNIIDGKMTATGEIIITRAIMATAATKESIIKDHQELI